MLIKEIYYSQKYDVQINFNENFPITPYTLFFLENLPTCKNSVTLDFGTGNGIYIIVAEKLGAINSIGIDIRIESKSLVKYNSDLNFCQNISWYKNIYSFKKSKYFREIDIILCNPSSIPNIDSSVPFYMDGGSLGNTMIKKMILLAKDSLKVGGKIFFLHTSLVPQSLTRIYLQENDFNYQVIAKVILPFRDDYFKVLDIVKKNKIKYPDIEIIQQHDVLYETVHLYQAEKLK